MCSVAFFKTTMAPQEYLSGGSPGGIQARCLTHVIDFKRVQLLGVFALLIPLPAQVSPIVQAVIFILFSGQVDQKFAPAVIFKKIGCQRGFFPGGRSHLAVEHIYFGAVFQDAGDDVPATGFWRSGCKHTPLLFHVKEIADPFHVCGNEKIYLGKSGEVPGQNVDQKKRVFPTYGHWFSDIISISDYFQ